MKTPFYEIDLMIPLQLNKDVVFNESLLKLDSLINPCVKDFLPQMPELLNVGDKFIITQGDDKNKICYRPSEAKQIAIYQPKDGMITYVFNKKSFYVFSSNTWQTITTAVSTDAPLAKHETFLGIEKKYIVPKYTHHYWYLKADTEIVINEDIQEMTIIIKQSVSNSYSIKWPKNILWSNSTPHKMSLKPNSVDLIKLYKIPESIHFTGSVIGQNCNY